MNVDMTRELKNEKKLVSSKGRPDFLNKRRNV